MVKRVALRQEDLLGSVRSPDAPTAEASVESAEEGSVSDLLGTVRQFNLEVQQTMVQFKELLSLAAQIRGGSFPGMGLMGAAAGGLRPGSPGPMPPPAAPAPDGMDPKAQVLAGLEQIKAEVGDVTLVELVNVLARQYGGLRLSDIIARIK